MEFAKLYFYAWIQYCIAGAYIFLPEFINYPPAPSQAVEPSAVEEYMDIVINYIWPAVLLIISWTLYRIIFSDE